MDYFEQDYLVDCYFADCAHLVDELYDYALKNRLSLSLVDNELHQKFLGSKGNESYGLKISLLDEVRSELEMMIDAD